jgi:hypothetical protein
VTYIKTSENTVARIDPDGISRLSCSVENPDYLAWLAAGNEPIPYAPTQEGLLAQAKALRTAEVAAIIITTASGKTFDGDERSQDRMGTTLAAMDADDVAVWVLSDNTVAQVSRDELREALRLARTEMAAIWVRPYQ